MSAYTARAAALANTLLPGGAATVVNFETVTFDPWGAVSVGTAWRWTAPWNGWVGLTLGLLLATGGTLAVGETVTAAVYRRGVAVANLAYFRAGSAALPLVWLSGSEVLAVNVGDWLDVRVAHSSAAALNVYTAGACELYNRVALWRVG